MMDSMRMASANDHLPEPGIYQHFKGARYVLLATARDSESDTLLVVYRAESDPSDELWVRPLEMFVETVQHNGRRVPRFAPTEQGRRTPRSVIRTAGTAWNRLAATVRREPSRRHSYSPRHG